MHRSNVHVKLYKLYLSYGAPSPGPDCTITPSLSLSMSDHDVSSGNPSVSNTSVTTAVKVVGMADMLGSAEMDGLTEGNWDFDGSELAMLDGFSDGISEVLGEDVKSVSQIKMEMELSLPKLPSILPSVSAIFLLSVLTSVYAIPMKPSPFES